MYTRSLCFNVLGVDVKSDLLEIEEPNYLFARLS
jgi:hypothetical protein